ncbi:MAG: MurT ligase domain-containing protein [Tepidiformaceae bacterium]
MDFRLAAAVMAGKTAGAVSRRLGRGGGTALPGLVALRIDPGAIRKLGGQLAGGRILVTGTNGKTTTARILARMLREAGVPYLHNREGSNLVRGMASTLLAAASPGGRLRIAGGRTGAIGLFETDEATLPPATEALAPRAIVFTNLFRDQLDRYSEVDTVAALWREALAAAPTGATLVLNADDPSVADLARHWEGTVHWFGLDDATLATDSAGAFDARWCGACGGTFVYSERYFAHIGHWRCSGCERARPAPETAGSDVRLRMDEARFVVAGLGGLTMPLSGSYNVYNALAAVATARVLGLSPQAMTAGLAAVRPAFGRQEVLELQGRRLHLLLCKNPAGANQALQMLDAVGGREGGLRIAVLLNDRVADGQDVSWVWDVDYEPLAGRASVCWVGGTRAEDMALRLKYAGWPPPAAVAGVPGAFLDAVLTGSERGEDVFVIATYTAMLDVRAELRRRGAAAHFWDDAEEGAAPAALPDGEGGGYSEKQR